MKTKSTLQERLEKLELSSGVHRNEIDQLIFQNYRNGWKINKLERLIAEMANKGSIDRSSLVEAYQKVSIDITKEMLALYERRVRSLKRYKAPDVVVSSEIAELRREQKKLRTYYNKKSFKKYFDKYVTKGLESPLEKVSATRKQTIIWDFNLFNR